jgi:hypothetical protein
MVGRRIGVAVTAKSISYSLNCFEHACIIIETPSSPRNISQLPSCSPESTHCDRKPAGPQLLPAHNPPVCRPAFIDIAPNNVSFQVLSNPSLSPRPLAAARGKRAVTPCRCKPSHCTLHHTHWHAQCLSNSFLHAHSCGVLEVADGQLWIKSTASAVPSVCRSSQRLPLPQVQVQRLWIWREIQTQARL